MSLSSTRRAIALDLFVRSADENYIASRFCASNGLYTDFLWLAVHCLEKYLKAVLLTNGQRSNRDRHDIVGLYKKVKALAGPNLLPNTLQRPVTLDIVIWQDMTLDDFIGHLQRYGNPDNRYLIFGHVSLLTDIYMLDQAVFAIRRLVCSLKDPVCSIDGMPTGMTYREELTKFPRFRRSLRMPLEREIDTNMDTPRRHAALDHNLPFAPVAFIHSKRRAATGAHPPVLDRRLLRPLGSTVKEIAAQAIEDAQWLLDHVQVPGGVRMQIQDAVDHARSVHNLGAWELSPYYQLLYLQEVLSQCRMAQAAYEALRRLLADEFEAVTVEAGQRRTADIMRNIHSMLTHVSKVSHLLWPPAQRDAEKRRRAAALRNVLELPETNHPLVDRTLRDDLEHFDERLDDWVAQRDPTLDFWQDTIGPWSMPQAYGAKPQNVMRLFDRDTLVFYFQGRPWNIPAMMAEVGILERRLEDCIRLLLVAVEPGQDARPLHRE